jgi:hypothetical protein
MTDLPVACTLSPEALRIRVSDLGFGILGRAIATEPLEQGRRWRFESEPDLFAQLAVVIDSERRCCPFLTFTVEAAPALGEVVLQVTGPTGTREFLATWP